MRRTATVALALATAICASLAAGVAPAAGANSITLAFNRAGTSTIPVSADSDRVFYVITASSIRTLFGDEEGEEYVDTGEYSEEDEGDDQEDSESAVQEAISSLPPDEDGLFRVLLGAGLANGASTYSQAMTDLDLPFAFAGREQWIRNLQGIGVESEPALWDVTMESVMRDQNSRLLLLGRAAERTERGLSSASDLSYWESLVPSWAPRVRDELAKKGVPFSVELLASPEINLTDPSAPLFPNGDMPLSLFGLGVLQKGENVFLRSLSAEELMLEIWPAYYRYYHRPAGAPVPDDLAAGLSFGSPVLLDDGRYLRSPMQQSDVYQRWLAYGYPGVSVIETGKTAPSVAAFDAILESDDRFLGEYQLFAPDSVSEDVLARYEALASGQ
jgi:hypothetical protein